MVAESSREVLEGSLRRPRRDCDKSKNSTLNQPKRPRVSLSSGRYRERIKCVLLDASILMLAYEGVDVLGEIERILDSKPKCLVLKPTLEELERLAVKAKPKRRIAARFAIELIKRYCEVVDYKSCKDEDPDTLFLRFVLEHGDVMPVTADNELRRRLREKGIPNIYYRRERHGLELEG